MNTLILGTGLLGSELRKQANWYAIGHDKFEIKKLRTLAPYLNVFDQFINCTGYTVTNHPTKEPSWTVNYTAVMDLVDYLNKHKKRYVHISTDYIYANSVREATELDVPVHYQNWYTYSKLLADAYVQARAKDYLLVRTSYKPRPFPWGGAWNNLKGNFDYVDVIAAKIIDLINRNESGVYNVGTELKTMYDLALQSRPGVTRMDNEVMPSDVSMNINKYLSR